MPNIWCAISMPFCCFAPRDNYAHRQNSNLKTACYRLSLPVAKIDKKGRDRIIMSKPQDKHVWKVAKPATNFQRVHIPEGAIYRTFSERTIKGKVCPAVCVYTLDFDALKKRDHITIYRIVDGKLSRPEYVNSRFGVCSGIKAFATTIDLDAIKVKPVILRRDLRGLAPKDREVGKYIYRGRPMKDKGTIQNLVTNGCLVGRRRHSEEMYEYAVMGVR